MSDDNFRETFTCNTCGTKVYSKDEINVHMKVQGHFGKMYTQGWEEIEAITDDWDSKMHPELPEAIIQLNSKSHIKVYKDRVVMYLPSKKYSELDRVIRSLMREKLGQDLNKSHFLNLVINVSESD